MAFTERVLESVDKKEIQLQTMRLRFPERNTVLGQLQSLRKLLEQLEKEPNISRMTKQAVSCLRSYLDTWQITDRSSLILLESKLDILISSIDMASKMPIEDLFNQSRSSERWRRLQEVVRVESPKDSKTIRKKFNSMLLNVASGLAMLESSSKNRFSRFFLAGAFGLYFNIFKQKALKKTMLFHARPKTHTALSLWNMMESSFILNMYKLVIPRLTVNKTLKIPRITDHVLGEGDEFEPVNIRFLSHKNCRTDSLIFHIHGGGFVAMSSASHQCYTRKWVRSLRMPCVSVDYRLAPQFPFPCALDDVWQAYNWVIKKSVDKLGVSPDKIYLAGDSAGGNLALALAYKIVQEGAKKPQGIMLAYPALDARENRFSPSMILTLEDALVPYKFLKMCGDCYLMNEEDRESYFASVVLAPDSVLELLPPVRILVGDRDPLHDDCWRFMERLLNVKVDAQMTVYTDFIHGSLNFCYKGGISETQKLVDQISNWIQELDQNPT